ncbi:hypothetical protein CKAH01_03787 [Colletotrichum kahawae]|uniref:Uncharacterized protein n=1 Tax=Colletotrichum kahawae TaxID=34407 RepID=A0AAE0DDQ6_COLKA|nr:hypothetical protein CKAH01_03787 [Colletotrichum kahawae]
MPSTSRPEACINFERILSVNLDDFVTGEGTYSATQNRPAIMKSRFEADETPHRYFDATYPLREEGRQR